VAKYKLTNFINVVIRTSDGASIPLDDGNRDYQEYKKYLKKGGKPEAAPEIIEVKPPSEEEKLIALLQKSKVQAEIVKIKDTQISTK
jgi:hypothetical protein